MFRLILIYAIFSYVIFLGVSVWMALFLLDVDGIRSSGPVASWPVAALLDILLISLFGVVHSVMARPSFKRFWTKIVPSSAERATYVLQSSLLLALIFLCWHPINLVVWNAKEVVAHVLLSIFAAGVLVILMATFLLDHFAFTGLRQAWDGCRNSPETLSRFRTPLLYRIVRHPLQLGIVLVIFAVPRMTLDGLLFALVMLVYIRVGLWFEERALLREFGTEYENYMSNTPMLIPRIVLRRDNNPGRPRV